MQQVLQTEKRYTYADYENMDDDNRYELLDGVIYLMSPPPTSVHQAVSGELFMQLGSFLRGKPCKVFAAPFGVRLDDETAVEPDLVVVCDKSKIDKKGCKGAPDMIIEIVSPSSASRDRFLKFNKYLKAGVREYWIVDPQSKDTSAHILENGKYFTNTYSEKDTIPVHVLEGCRINMKEVFENIWPDEEKEGDIDE